MPLTETRKRELDALCLQFRRDLLRLLHGVQSGHPGGSLSCCEILTVLYQELLRVDPKDPKKPDRDRLILSKGHAAPMLYLNLAKLGFFPETELSTLRTLDSRLQGHPSAGKTPGVELSAGPLGLGLSAGLGMSLSASLTGQDYDTYVILGDGELQEGCVWEAAMSAAKFKADRLVAVLDHNGVQLDGANDEIMPLGDIAAKFAAFGWKTFACDGHDVSGLYDALCIARDFRGGPSVVIAETVKGKGVSFMEGKSAWHGAPVTDQDYAAAMAQLGVRV